LKCLNVGRLGGWNSKGGSHPQFFVSVAFKGVSFGVSLLFATLARGSICVEGKGVRGANGWRERNGLGWERVEGVGRTAWREVPGMGAGMEIANIKGRGTCLRQAGPPLRQGRSLRFRQGRDVPTRKGRDLRAARVRRTGLPKAGRPTCGRQARDRANATEGSYHIGTVSQVLL